MSEIERLRAVLEAATPGPWVRVGNHVYRLEAAAEVEITRDPTPGDARAIAALGTLWPELLAVIDAVHDEHGTLAACAPEVRALRRAIARHFGDAE